MKVKFLNREISIITIITFFIFLFFALFHFWNMAYLTPEYDELYSFHCFVMQGPKYTVTHWPAPNNHVLYNLLSAIVSFFIGNKKVILRSVAYVSYVVLSILLYLWIRKEYDEITSLVAVFLLGINSYTHSYASQGRGYSLAMLLFFIAFFVCVQIISKEKRSELRWFILWTIVISLAVYDVPSNLYWIFLLYLGTLILARRYIGKMLKMTVFSGLGGILTCLLYLPIWLTIADESGYGNESFINRITFGIKTMLSNQFIQGKTREEMMAEFWQWINEVGDMLIFRFGIISILIICFASFLLLLTCFKVRKSEYVIDNEKKTVLFLSIFSFFGVFVLLLLQSTLPFPRVLCFLGVCFVFIISTVFYVARKYLDAMEKKVAISLVVCSVVLCMYGFIFHQLAGVFVRQRMDHLMYIFNNVLEKTDNIIRGDEYSELFFMYYWDYFRDCPPNTQEDPNVIILNNLQLDKDYEKEWPCFFSYDEIPWDKVDEMTIVYKDSEYTVYVKNTY